MKHKISAVLLIFIITVGVYGFYALFERYETTEDLGWDRAALRNPYLAAALFLRQLGVDVQSYNSFDKLDPLPENGTLFVSNSSHVLSAKQVYKLSQWVKGGGHLIIAASAPGSGESDRLLASFAIENRVPSGNADAHMKRGHRQPSVVTSGDRVGQSRERRASFPRDNEEPKRAAQAIASAAGQTDNDDNATPDDELSRLRFDGVDPALTLHFLPTRTLYHPTFDRQHQQPLVGNTPIYWAGDKQGVHFIQLEVEQGMLSVLSDGVLWHSEQIDKFDHAFFLRTLARDGNGVRLLYGTQMPSLPTLIWRHASPLVIASALWIVAWLLYRGRRFGPIVQQRITVRRSMAEHIFASANYLWRGAWIEPLLTPVRDSIKWHLQRTVPKYEQLDEHAQYQHLSTYSGISLARIEEAMRSNGKQHEDHFLETIQCLQQIRKSL
jgi:hypothetical protein